MTITREWLQSQISAIETVGITESNTLEAFKIALASLEAEPDYIRYDCGCCGWETLTEWRDNDVCPKCNHKPLGTTELYTAPPAPVAMKDHQIRELVNVLRDIAVEYHATQQLREHIARAVRAAMQGKAEPVSQPYKLPTQSSDAVNEAAWNLHDTLTEFGPLTGHQFNNLKSCFYEALKLAVCNSPVIPDDVRRMDWLVSKTVNVREPMVYGSHSLFWSQTITDEEDDYHATKLREQIDEAMAAKQPAASSQQHHSRRLNDGR